MNLNDFTIQELDKIKKPAMQFSYGHPTKNTGPDTESHLGGKPFITKGTEWPTCVFCKKEMFFFLQLRDFINHDHISLKTFFKCDCKMENNHPSISIREYKNPSEKSIDHDAFGERVFDSYRSIRLEPLWTVPAWNFLPSYHKKLYDKIASFYEDPEDAEDFYEDQRMLQQMIPENPFSFMYGYPEFYIQDKDSVKCNCCNEYTSFYFQIHSIPKSVINWNNETLYCYVCPRKGTYFFTVN